VDAGAPGDVHVVVFDINVFLDAARLLGPPLTWDEFSAAVAKCANDPHPHPTDKRIDSLRALAMCTSGRFAGGDLLQVWTSGHIVGLAVEKAVQPVDGATDEQRGLGWSAQDADALQDFIDDLTFIKSRGGSIAVKTAEGSPPLSYEDGLVYRTAREAGDPTNIRYCVTRDVEFRELAAEIMDDITVLYPWEWVDVLRKSRALVATQAMRPRPPFTGTA